MTPDKTTAPGIPDKTVAPGFHATSLEWQEEYSIYGGRPRVRQTGEPMQDTQHPDGTCLLPDRVMRECEKRARMEGLRRVDLEDQA
jgi:hypothetical protein